MNASDQQLIQTCRLAPGAVDSEQAHALLELISRLERDNDHKSGLLSRERTKWFWPAMASMLVGLGIVIGIAYDSSTKAQHRADLEIEKLRVAERVAETEGRDLCGSTRARIEKVHEAVSKICVEVAP